ncbi:fatty acyl-AMP ligase [Actinomadura sp. 21ATH]|uniref:fatty acyl-AMP ligase n=1 Tax=Actinomadura sp. 21ATH TaxID=1735444 RepID=UPI0035C0887B
MTVTAATARPAAAAERGFVQVVRDNVREYGNARGFTFVSEVRGPGRTYREEDLGLADLDRGARALAGHLHGLGVRDEAVLLLYPEGLDFITAFVGCLYARVIAVPAPFPDLDAGRAERTRRIIDDAGIRWILTDSAHREMLETWVAASGLSGIVRCLATDADVTADPDAWTMPEYDPSATAFLQYTSGSTSDPKGVVVSHGNLLRNAQEINARIEGGAHSVGIGWVPHYHDMGLVGQILHPLYMAGRYVLMSPITFIKRPALWLELVGRHRATIIVGPNFGYELLLRRVTDEQVAGLDLASLLTVKNGAEPVLAGTLDRMVERFGPAGFRREIWMPCYGMAETTLLISGAPLGTGPVIREFDYTALTRNEAVPVNGAARAPDPRTDAGDGFEGSGTRRLVSSGRPVTLDVRVVDPVTREPLPDGRIGEIWVAGGSVAQGYWKRPAETREIFQAVTAEGRGPYLRTGDLGFLAGGEVYVTGRIKDLIIVNGHNIYAHDLEEAARAAHPAARTSAAFSLALPPDRGREQVIIVQEVIPGAVKEMGLPELAAHTRDVVARTFGLPALSVVLSGRGAVRRTTSGKIQRRLTRQDFLEGRIKQLAVDLEPDIAALERAGV